MTVVRVNRGIWEEPGIARVEYMREGNEWGQATEGKKR